MPVLIHYTVLIDALTMRVIDGKHKVTLGVTTIGLDRDGNMVERKVEQITMSLPEDILHRSPDLPVTVDQQIYLSRMISFSIWAYGIQSTAVSAT